jgi:DNA helicase-2/ATP-dependent DNA helicase PcrA
LIGKSSELPLLNLLDKVMDSSGYKAFLLKETEGEDRWENILELRTVAKEHNELPPRDALSDFLEGIALVADVDSLDEKVDVVTLITLHQAKGLEFPIVFIVGTEEDLLPHSKSKDDPSQLEEERRLFYVGITRAKWKVYLVRAFRRSLMGNSSTRLPSRFLRDIPSHLTSGDGAWRGEESPVVPQQYSWQPATTPPRLPLAELKTGDRVRHAKFGDGMVVSLKPSTDDSEVTVAFEGAGLKKLSLNFAPLEKI